MSKEEFAFLFTKLGLTNLGDIQSDFLVAAFTDLNPEVKCQLHQLLFIFNLKVLGFSFGHQLEGLDNFAAVVTVSCRSSRNLPHEVPCGDGLCSSPTDTGSLGMIFGSFLLILRQWYPARSHSTVTTAAALAANGAGFHLFSSVEDCAYILLLSFFNHFKGCLVNTFHFIFCHSAIPLQYLIVFKKLSVQILSLGLIL